MLGAERRAHRVEEVAERLLGVAAVVQQRGDLVQQAQVLLLLAGAGVGAVGRDDQERGQRQQGQRGRVADRGAGEDQADGGRAQGEGQRQRQHLQQGRQVGAALGQADDGEDAQVAVTVMTRTATSAASQSQQPDAGR